MSAGCADPGHRDPASGHGTALQSPTNQEGDDDFSKSFGDVEATWITNHGVKVYTYAGDVGFQAAAGDSNNLAFNRNSQMSKISCPPPILSALKEASDTCQVSISSVKF